MAKPKTTAGIDCERCRNFTGSAFWVRFACAKGHTNQEPEHDYFLHRKSCVDYDHTTRAELIFMRRKSSFAGGEAIQRDALQVKRTATSLRKLTNENALGQYLSSSELEHFRAAIAALDGLAPDLTRAAKMGERYKEEHQKALRTKHEDEMLRLVADTLPDASPDTLMRTVEDLREFGRKWRSTPAAPNDEPVRAKVLLFDRDAILVALAACHKAGTPANVRSLTVELGEQIEQMRYGDRRNTGGWIDFLEYSRFLALQRKLMASTLPPSDLDTAR